MRKWFVHDSDGREIYLTEERWEHIANEHSELRNHLEDVLNTVGEDAGDSSPKTHKLMSIGCAAARYARLLTASWLSWSSALQCRRTMVTCFPTILLSVPGES